MNRRFALLDRDGTLIVERPYLATSDGLELLPNTLAGLRLLADLGLGLVVVGNQSGVGRGLIAPTALEAIHDRLRELLGQAGMTLDGIFTCPHTDEDGCGCRKPEPGLVRQAATELGFNPADGFVVGDKACDIDLGRTVGATSILVRTGYGNQAGPEVEARADHVVTDILEAARLIESLL